MGVKCGDFILVKLNDWFHEQFCKQLLDVKNNTPLGTNKASQDVVLNEDMY